MIKLTSLLERGIPQVNCDIFFWIRSKHRLD